MEKLEALLIGGYWPEVMEVTFGLLVRAGFTVDVISNSTAFRKSGAMREYVLAKKRDLLVKTAAEKIKKRICAGCCWRRRYAWGDIKLGLVP